jgi:serine/threonine protein kinase
MPLEPGEIVGDYRVLGILGEGGMGQVYKVQNVLSNRIEAMKILLPDLSVQPQQLERFLREIQVQASLVHPNIASLHTASRQDNRLLMFMELVDGETLAARLAAGALPVEQTVNITTQLLNALSYAHERGVVHRDIKPSNIMLTPGGVAKLLDFGLAAARGDKRLTMTGNVLGSLHYMSPEQVRGDAPTPASDIYSLGLTVYEMLTGRRGIEGPSDYAVMTAHLQSMPEPPANINPEVPELLSRIVLQAVSKAPSARFASALEFKGALDRYRQAPAASTPAPPKVEPVAVPVRHQPDLSPIPTQTLAPSPAQPVQPIPDLSPPVPMQTVVHRSAERVTPALQPQVRHSSRMLAGTVAGAVVLMIGGALLYHSRITQESAAPVTATQPAVQTPAEPPSSQRAPVQPAPPAATPVGPAVQIPSSPRQQKPAEKRAVVPTEAKSATPSTPPAPPPDPPAATQPPATAPPTATGQQNSTRLAELDREIQRLENQISNLRQLYTDSNPDVKTAQGRLAAARKRRADILAEDQAPAGPAKGGAKTGQQQQAEEWAQVSGSRDPAQLRKFLAAYPDGPLAAQAATMLSDFEWATLLQVQNAPAFREFAARYPASSHAAEAVSAAARIEDSLAVHGTILSFAEAFSARDLNRVRGLWPGASTETVGRISELFKKSRTVTLTLRPQGEMRLATERAEVACQERLTVLDGSKPRTTDATARVRLVKSGGAWTIDSIVSTPPSLYNPF